MTSFFCLPIYIGNLVFIMFVWVQFPHYICNFVFHRKFMIYDISFFVFLVCVFQAVLSGEFAILLKFLHSAFFYFNYLFFPMFVVVNLLRLLLFFGHPSWIQVCFEFFSFIFLFLGWPFRCCLFCWMQVKAEVKLEAQLFSASILQSC